MMTTFLQDALAHAANLYGGHVKDDGCTLKMEGETANCTNTRGGQDVATLIASDSCQSTYFFSLQANWTPKACNIIHHAFDILL